MGHAQTGNERGQHDNTEMTTSGQHKKFKLNLLANLLLSKPTQTASKTIIGHVPSSKQHINYNQQLQNKTIKRSKQKREDGRALPHDLLDNGQGKFTTEVAAAPADMSNNNRGSDMNISTNDSRDIITNPNMEWSKLEIAPFKFAEQMSLG